MSILLVPSDIVKVIFYYYCVKLGETKRTVCINCSHSKINTSFYKISQQDKFKSLFKEFTFDTSRMYPRSETVEFALDRLIGSHQFKFMLLENLYYVDDKFYTKEIYELNLFNNEKLELLKEAASVLEI